MKLKAHTKVRNPVARSPLLHKGGLHHSEDIQTVHRKNRKQSKLSLKRMDWNQ
ncbi:hypothetical protein I2F27_07615 [Acinetobacter sp. B5B]|uniref:hypothetical protein n=1 Tax=Acinetobacter baretiae TaxID=2605383 RepID=UPI0018C290B3|nr:hypothetical protein [Acinetobacter baretiae]MBF7683192.1 hypothetical protein [Acinetobacter baretiae]MBF7684443.1 hypothetical protein [Acinetobacter baretiae]